MAGENASAYESGDDLFSVENEELSDSSAECSRDAQSGLQTSADAPDGTAADSEIKGLLETLLKKVEQNSRAIEELKGEIIRYKPC